MSTQHHDRKPLSELRADIFASVAVIVFVLAAAAIAHMLVEWIR